MFSTPLISCSMGVATVSAATVALAPGYSAETWMVGGATSGYCAIGSPSRATPPTMTMTTESTVAKMGRSMKKCEIIGRSCRKSRSAGGGHGVEGDLAGSRTGNHLSGFRLHHEARLGPLDAGDDDALPLRQA